MFLLACAWLLVLRDGQMSIRPWKWNWGKASAALALALFVLWAGYFFHVSRLTIEHGVLTATHPHWTSTLVKPTRSHLNISIPVPAGEYVAGFRDLVFHNAHGQKAFFLGQISPNGGWKAYYPVSILLKWPFILLIASVSGLVLWVRWKVSPQRHFWIMFSFPVLYFALAIFSHFNIGERHILPLYPFTLVLAGAFGEYLRTQKWGVLLASCLLLLNAADVLRYAPGYLSFMNVPVSPASSYRLLSDSNLDWGEGLIAVRNYEEKHPGEGISLAYFGSVDPQIYGIRAHRLAEGDRVSGTVIVGATELSGQYLRNGSAYRWLLHHKPTEVLDHCMYVFRVD
jgi:hypothetical protein